MNPALFNTNHDERTAAAIDLAVKFNLNKDHPVIKLFNLVEKYSLDIAPTQFVYDMLFEIKRFYLQRPHEAILFRLLLEFLDYITESPRGYLSVIFDNLHNDFSYGSVDEITQEEIYETRQEFEKAMFEVNLIVETRKRLKEFKEQIELENGQLPLTAFNEDCTPWIDELGQSFFI